MTILHGRTMSARLLRNFDLHSRQSMTALTVCWAELAIFLRRVTLLFITWRSNTHSHVRPNLIVMDFAIAPSSIIRTGLKH